MTDLIPLTAVAQRLGISIRTAVCYRHRGLPAPVVPHNHPDNPGAALYSWREVEAWAEKYDLYDSMVGLATPARMGERNRWKEHADAV